METIKGIGASVGISKAKPFFIKHEELKIVKTSISNSSSEIIKFEKAIESAKKDITILREKTLSNLGEEKAAIFDAHLAILEDPAIVDEVKEKINSEKLNASFIYKEKATEFFNMFASMDDAYMKERSADVLDVSTRVLRILENKEVIDLSAISSEVIIIAHDLTPSETSQLNPKFVKGFITEIGGRTSHSAIMARTLEIPAIVGVGSKVFEIDKNATILMDGGEGVFYLNPDASFEKELIEKAKKLELDKKESLLFKDKNTQSKDGWKTLVVANIGSPKDLDGVLKNGAEGVGLFRTEFLYMDSSDWPNEEEQFNAYKTVLQTMNPKPVVIRTLDIGGDKTLSYFKFPYEMNPFLGYRAVRLQLDKKDILRTQVRALLRASHFGKLAIDIPMIATIEEFLDYKAEVNKVKEELIKEGHKVGKYELGIMVEVPSTVELIDKFSKYADFFSIGSNDLIQYTFAADRMSEKVSYLYQPFNPAILRKVAKVISQSHKAGRWTAICGEIASEPLLAPVFVGMGLDEFSMSASSILSMRKLISKINKKEAEVLVTKVLDCENEKEVIALIKDFFKKSNIEIL